MNPESYVRYSHEVSSWLHSGRKKLIRQVLDWHLPPGSSGQLELLEVGAGVGQNVELLRDIGAVDVMELDPLGLDRLRSLDGVRQVFDAGIPTDLAGSWDVILACDVIEHIEDDAAAVRWIFDHLKPGGLFFATVPAFQWLFSDHDRALGHFRRYEADVFDRLLPADASRLSGSYFNSYLFPLAVLSRASYQLSRRTRKTTKLEKQRVPGGRLTEPMLGAIFSLDLRGLKVSSRRKWGLSYYVCARKPV
jgi:2-polyprenyl-3-methyl-5-hydroxy-6-metoxy-1,4-benzoquinol methylase